MSLKHQFKCFIFLKQLIEAKINNRMYYQQVEVFNLLFVKKSESEENKFVVYCWQCSKHIDQFIVLNQHKIEDLFNIYDNFTLVSKLCHRTILSSNLYSKVSSCLNSLKL